MLGMQELDIDWESSLYHDGVLPESGVVLPELPTPLNEQDMTELAAAGDLTEPSDSHGRDIYCRCLQIFQWATVMLVSLSTNCFAIYCTCRHMKKTKSQFVELNKHLYI